MKQEITFEDYNKVEIKVGTVLSVKKNEKARKPSLVVEVDFGRDIGVKITNRRITCRSYCQGVDIIDLCRRGENMWTKGIVGVRLDGNGYVFSAFRIPIIDG